MNQITRAPLDKSFITMYNLSLVGFSVLQFIAGIYRVDPSYSENRRRFQERSIRGSSL